MFISYILDKLAPLLALFASKLILEALKMYKDLLFEIFNGCDLQYGIHLVGNLLIMLIMLILNLKKMNKQHQIK